MFGCCCDTGAMYGCCCAGVGPRYGCCAGGRGHAIPVAEPFVEALFGAACRPRKTRGGQSFFAPFNQKRQRMLQDHLLARRELWCSVRAGSGDVKTGGRHLASVNWWVRAGLDDFLQEPYGLSPSHI